ncbi:MAG: conjugal transfer protein TrbD [Rhodomicrobium sp.]|jgi:type IV secretion system protein VirB3
MLRRTPLYRALHRQNLLIGGEREPVLASAIACAGLPAASSNLVALTVGLGLWLFLIGVLRMMAKADPMMTRVYLRQLIHPAYFPARSRPSRVD